MYINNAMVFGNLTRDPELKALPNGGQVATFSIATNRRYKKANGEHAEETTFHNIVVFGKAAESCAQYLRKGSSAYVDGRISTRSWEGENGRQYRTEIVAQDVQFGPRSAAGLKDKPDAAQASKPAATEQPEAKSRGFEYPDEDINPDDIPF